MSENLSYVNNCFNFYIVFQRRSFLVPRKNIIYLNTKQSYKLLDNFSNHMHKYKLLQVLLEMTLEFFQFFLLYKF